MNRKPRPVVAVYPSTLRYQFIMTELVVGITHCRAAATTQDQARKERNRRLAQQAYSAAAHHARGAVLSAAMRQEVRSKTDQLKSLLANLQVSADELPRFTLL